MNTQNNRSSNLSDLITFDGQETLEVNTSARNVGIDLDTPGGLMKAGGGVVVATAIGTVTVLGTLAIVDAMSRNHNVIKAKEVLTGKAEIATVPAHPQA